jgi:predicted YcjX-like family ATPase
VAQPFITLTNLSGWGYPDTRHLNQIGHRDMAMLIGSFIHDVTCEMLAEPHFSLGSATAAPFASDSDWLDSWETKKEVVSLHSEAEEALLPSQARQWVMEGKDGEQSVLMPGRFMAPSEMGMIPRVSKVGDNCGMADSSSSARWKDGILISIT